MSGVRQRLREVASWVGAFVSTHGVWVTALLTVLVFAGMVVFADASRIRRAFAAFDWTAFGVVLGLATLGYAVRFLKWEYYLRRLDVDVGLGASAITFFSGLMMVVTPGKAGEVWKAWFLREERGVPASRTTTVVGAERVTDLLALSALAACGLVLFDRSSVVLVGVVTVFAVGILLLQWRAAWMRVLGWIETLPRIGEHAATLESFYEDAADLFRFRPLLVATVLSTVAWALEGLALWVALEGFGVDANPIVGLFVFGLGSVVGAVSMLPGGLGAAEASMVGLLLTFGYAESVAVGATMVLRVGTLWYAAGLGLVVFAGYKLLGGGVSADRETDVG